jgi:hypothetical protein
MTCVMLSTHFGFESVLRRAHTHKTRALMPYSELAMTGILQSTAPFIGLEPTPFLGSLHCMTGMHVVAHLHL